MHTDKHGDANAGSEKAHEAKNGFRDSRKTWRKTRYFCLRIMRSSPDRVIELVFAFVIVLFTGMQYKNTKENNESTSYQTDELISAAKYNAYAAKQTPRLRDSSPPVQTVSTPVSITRSRSLACKLKGLKNPVNPAKSSLREDLRP